MRIALAASAAVLMILSACSSEDEAAPDEHTTEAANEAEEVEEAEASEALEQAVEDYSDAFLSGEGATAFALLSERCRDRTPEGEFLAAVGMAGTMYGPMVIESLEVAVNGTQAQATYTYEASELDQDREPWTFEDGQWHNDDC